MGKNHHARGPMPKLGDAVRAKTDQQAKTIEKSGGRFKVATTSPFTVYLDGGSVAVSARKVVGLSYSVGTTGDYFLRQGQSPLCVPTA